MQLFRVFVLAIASIVAAHATSVIFVHPDGAGVAHWQAARFIQCGPDGDLHWDRLPAVAIYRGHLKNNLTATSNGGATVHAYGVKVPANAFGSDGKTANPPVSAGGKAESLMLEVARAGYRVGVINSGSIIEPGTACFLASVKARKECEEITRQVLASGADIILSGGEEWMLPADVTGFHGEPGKRKDGRNLIKEAEENGYVVVFDREQLAAVPGNTKKLLGVFATGHTFNDQTEEFLGAANLPTYQEQAPTLAEMTAKALELFSGNKFFLVVEEEGSDNFGNYNNAQGTLDSLLRADAAIGVALAFVEKNPDTFLITTADSEAGGMDVIGINPDSPEQLALVKNARDRNGAPYDNVEGKPFLSAPDQAGIRHPFVITWNTFNDSSGGIVIRAAGRGADRVRGTMDNTDVYRLMRESMLGSAPDSLPAN
jgi:alkaline phosphatase